jgi:two-component system CheB/CheR fusion protein
MAGEKGDKTPRRKREDKKPDEKEQATDQQGPAQEPPPEEIHDRAPCPVVGVGASAGGLEALQGLFDSMPPEPGVAFIVVQHRATDRTSVMKSLIEKHTSLRVEDLEDGVKVEPDTIYLAPADQDVSILSGVLYLIEPPPHPGIRLPIDSFLRPLARDEAIFSRIVVELAKCDSA